MDAEFEDVTITTYQMIETVEGYSNSEREYRCIFTPHPNVALFRHRGQTDGRICHATVSHSKDLVEVMDECLENFHYLSDEFRKRILLQVTHGLNHLHSYGISHGHIAPENILFPCSAGCPNVVLADFEYHQNDEATPATIKQDMTQLAEVFEYVLKNGDSDREPLLWRDFGIASRLLTDMRENREYSTTDILRHPFFWSDDKKINFLSRSVDILDNRKKMVKLDGRESYIDWTERLSLSTYEYDQCNQYLAEVATRPISCSKDAVKERARRKHKEEKRKKLSELLRFFRNTKTHFCELLGPISWSFQDDETSRYWRFFAKRYPNLFYNVYDVMSDNELLRLKGFGEIYLETERENAPLPDISHHKIKQEFYEQDFQYEGNHYN